MQIGLSIFLFNDSGILRDNKDSGPSLTVTTEEQTESSLCMI